MRCALLGPTPGSCRARRSGPGPRLRTPGCQPLSRAGRRGRRRRAARRRGAGRGRRRGPGYRTGRAHRPHRRAPRCRTRAARSSPAASSPAARLASRTAARTRSAMVWAVSAASAASMAAGLIVRSTRSPCPLTLAFTSPPPALPSTTASASSCCAFMSWSCICCAAASSCCISIWPPGSTVPSLGTVSPHLRAATRTLAAPPGPGRPTALRFEPKACGVRQAHRLANGVARRDWGAQLCSGTVPVRSRFSPGSVPGSVPARSRVQSRLGPGSFPVLPQWPRWSR